MNTAIGVDIEKVSRFRSAMKNGHFLRHTFSEEEIEYCRSAGKGGERSLAGMFAAKEASCKALNQLYPFHRFVIDELEIAHKKSGAPFLRPMRSSRFHEKHSKEICFQSSISISHSGEYAIAAVLIQSVNQDSLGS